MVFTVESGEFKGKSYHTNKKSHVKELSILLKKNLPKVLIIHDERNEEDSVELTILSLKIC